MKIYFDCISCFVRQMIEASEMATKNPTIRENIIRKSLNKLSKIPYNKTPTHIGMEIHRIVRDNSGNIDPYQKLKEEYNKKALDLYPQMKEIVKNSKNPLETATRIAIAGNIIDFGISIAGNSINLTEIIDETLKRPFAINNFLSFKDALELANNILYLGDNAGEIVFDRILIEEIPDYRRKVKFAVKGSPVVNDSTLRDAEETGLADIVQVIENGSDAPGTILETCSNDFIEEFRKADLILAKGQGNYETLSEDDHKIFFLLKAKCPVVAKDLSVNIGDIILKSG